MHQFDTTKATEFVRRQVDRGPKELGGRLNATADGLDTAGQEMETRGDDLTATLAHQVAKIARRVGFYLETTNSQQMLEDARRFTREQPWTVAAIGVAAGFVLSRFIKHMRPPESPRRDAPSETNWEYR